MLAYLNQTSSEKTICYRAIIFLISQLAHVNNFVCLALSPVPAPATRHSVLYEYDLPIFTDLSASVCEPEHHGFRQKGGKLYCSCAMLWGLARCSALAKARNPTMESETKCLQRGWTCVCACVCYNVHVI